MGFCYFVIGGVMGGNYIDVFGGVGNFLNVNIVIVVYLGVLVNIVIIFLYFLIVVYVFMLVLVCWIYVVEVWFFGICVIGMLMVVLFNWVFNFVLGMFMLLVFVNIIWKFFIIFGVLCVVVVIWFWVFYLEICGKMLEEIEVMFFKDGLCLWNIRKGEFCLVVEIEVVIVRKEKGEQFGLVEIVMCDGENKVQLI